MEGRGSASLLEQLRREGKLRLLDMGAGAGAHAAFFENAGLELVAIDASPAMVAACRAKGLEALEMDFMSLSFEGTRSTQPSP